MDNSTPNSTSAASGSDSALDTAPEIEVDGSLTFDKNKLKGQVTQSVTQHIAPDLTASAKITQSAVVDASGFGAGIAATAAVTKKIGDAVTAKISDTFSADFRPEDISLKASQSASVTYDNGSVSDSLTLDTEAGYSSSDGFEASAQATHATKGENYSFEERGKVGLGLDGEKLTLGGEYGASSRIGSDDYYVENTSNTSLSMDSDGGLKSSSTYGTNVKAGNVEYGSSVTASSSSSENSESQSVEAKQNVGIQTSEGTKLTHETSVKESETVEEDEESITTTEKSEINMKTRIEIDPEKATVGEAVTATVFNAAAAVTESILNEAMSSENETTEEKDTGEEEEASKSEAQQKAETLRAEADRARAEEAQARQQAEQALDEVQDRKEDLEKAQADLEEAQKKAEEAEEEEAQKAQEEVEKAQEEVEKAQADYEQAQENSIEATNNWGEKNEEAQQAEMQAQQAEMEAAQEQSQSEDYSYGY